jgi:hypothetical protein
VRSVVNLIFPLDMGSIARFAADRSVQRAMSPHPVACRGRQP